MVEVNKLKMKIKLLELMKKYVDKNGVIDIIKFRVENRGAYRTLYRYFKNVPEALDCGGWVKNKVNKQAELLSLMKSYVDKNNMIDMTKFRLEQPSAYKSLHQHFGGVPAAIKYGGWVKNNAKTNKIKIKLLKLLRTYVNENNKIDIRKFRADNLNEYYQCIYYFKGLSYAIKQGGWIKE